MSEADMIAFYGCISPKLAKSYSKKGNEVATVYDSWGRASRFPAAPGVHSGHYLMTYVNDVGHDMYVDYGADPLPVGTVIAEENFKIKANGT